MKIYPLQDRVLVQRIVEEEKTTSGLFIPDAAKEKSNRGIVLRVGPGKYISGGYFVEPDISKDDEILFNKYAVLEIEKDILLMREDEILAIVEKD